MITNHTLSFKIILNVVIGVVLISLMINAVHASDVAPINGKGIWIWKISEIENGNIDSIIKRCQNSNVDWVAVKCGDGVNFWEFQCNSDIISKFHKAGIKILGWQYVYGVKPIEESKVAIKILDSGVDGLIIDAEAEYEGKPEIAKIYLENIRSNNPDSFIAYTTFAIISYHKNFPYLEFGKYCDAVMPQAYWKDIKVSPEKMIEWLDKEWNFWQKEWEKSGYGDSIKPIYPIGQGYNVSADEIARFCKGLSGKEYNGISLWRYGTLKAKAWEVYSKCWGRLKETKIIYQELKEQVDLYNQNVDKIPGFIRTIFGNERIEAHINDGKEEVIGIVTKDAIVIEFKEGGIENPTLKVYTDKETIYKVIKQKNPDSAIQVALKALDEGKIRYEAVGVVTQIKTTIFTILIKIFDWLKKLSIFS